MRYIAREKRAFIGFLVVLRCGLRYAVDADGLETNSMTVAELIEKLSAFAPDLPVHMSWDSGLAVGEVGAVVGMRRTWQTPEDYVCLACGSNDLPRRQTEPTE
jgi:hypothetical protein